MAIDGPLSWDVAKYHQAGERTKVRAARLLKVNTDPEHFQFDCRHLPMGISASSFDERRYSAEPG